MAAKKGAERRKSPRKPVKSEMEFIFYMDAFKAKALDISEHGISFETETPILIRLTTGTGGEKITRDAKLVWAVKLPEGMVRYGFEFIPDLD